MTAFPTISVQVSFTDPYATPSWTDITRYVQSFTTTMGRQHELQQVNPSTAAIVLWNGPTSHGDTTGGRFSPWNTGSPYYHSGLGLVPTRPVRITATYASTTYPIFYGYVDNWTPGYGQTSSLVTLNCSDILKLLNLNTLDDGTYEVLPTASAKAYYPLSDPVSSLTAVDIKGGGSGSVVGSVAFGSPGPLLNDPATGATVTSIAQIQVPASVSGTHVSADGWMKATDPNCYILGYGASNVNLFLGPSSTSGYAQAQVQGVTVNSFVNVCDGNWHYLAVTADHVNLRLYVDGNLVGEVASTATMSSATGRIADVSNYSQAQFAQIAVYDSALTSAQILNQFKVATAGFIEQDSGSRIAAVLALAGVPSGLTNIGLGSIYCQGATSSLSTTTAMSYLNTVVNTERGLLYQDPTGVIQFRNREYVYINSTSVNSQATFGYASGQLHYYSTSFVPAEDDIDTWNNIPVQRTNGTIQVASDATSQGHYGRRTLTGYTNLLFLNDSDSADLASGLLYQYKNPMTRVRALTVDNLISAGAALPQMLGRALLDRVTINWRPLDGSSVDFSQQSLIEQVSHTVDAQTRTWTTTFAVTPIGTENFANYGTDTYGTGVYGF